MKLFLQKLNQQLLLPKTNVITSEDLLVPETNEPKVDPEYQNKLNTLLQRVKDSKHQMK